MKCVVEKCGRRSVLGVSRVTLWRLLEMEPPAKPEYVKPLLKLCSNMERQTGLEVVPSSSLIIL